MSQGKVSDGQHNDEQNDASEPEEQPTEPHPSDARETDFIIRGSTKSVMAEADFGSVKDSSRALRESWHDILRKSRGFTCYGIFLLFPSDKEVLSYLRTFGTEVDIISRDSCLLIFLGATEIRRPSLDPENWQRTIDRHVTSGQSVEIADVLGIKISEFPCLVIFRDLRSGDFVSIHLLELEADEIATRMRSVFSTIKGAVSEKGDPVSAIERSLARDGLLTAIDSMAGGVRKLAVGTFETAMEVWIKQQYK